MVHMVYGGMIGDGSDKDFLFNNFYDQLFVPGPRESPNTFCSRVVPVQDVSRASASESHHILLVDIRMRKDLHCSQLAVLHMQSIQVPDAARPPARGSLRHILEGAMTFSTSSFRIVRAFRGWGEEVKEPTLGSPVHGLRPSFRSVSDTQGKVQENHVLERLPLRFASCAINYMDLLLDMCLCVHHQLPSGLKSTSISLRM